MDKGTALVLANYKHPQAVDSALDVQDNQLPDTIDSGVQTELRPVKKRIRTRSYSSVLEDRSSYLLDLLIPGAQTAQRHPIVIWRRWRRGFLGRYGLQITRSGTVASQQGFVFA